MYLQLCSFADRDLYMRFRGGGIGHTDPRTIERDNYESESDASGDDIAVLDDGTEENEDQSQERELKSDSSSEEEFDEEIDEETDEESVGEGRSNDSEIDSDSSESEDDVEDLEMSY